jgi:two-component system OmpR family response regulator
VEHRHETDLNAPTFRAVSAIVGMTVRSKPERNRMRVLLVEDDRLIGSAVAEHLSGAGDAVDWARSIADAEDLLAVGAFDIVLLDLGLPDGSGLDLLRRLRSGEDPAPVIVLTARDRIADRIEGLNAGADDYLVKPFDLDELTARMFAVARRSAGRASPVVRIGSVEFAPADRAASRDGVAVGLTQREWSLLDAFLRRPGATLSKAQLEEALYAFGEEIESNTVEVYVSRLRRKLGADLIRTIRGVGYRIERP